MTASHRVRGIVAVLATLVAATLATSAQGDAHASTGSAGEAAAKPAKTTLHLHITGCDRCSVQLWQAIDGRPHVWHSAKQKIGADHRATFHVPTRRTHGMSFTLDAPWAKGVDAVPNMVTRYRGHAIDTSVSRKGARHAGRAEGCWAGTSLDELRLDFAVSRVKSKTLAGAPAPAPLVWATHSLRSWKPMVKTYKGMIGNQDAFYCERPKTTEVTFQTPGCDGCKVAVMNGAIYAGNVWGDKEKTVSGDSVSFRIPRPATRGLTMTVFGPWEGTTDYTTVVAFRYAGHQVGDPVSFADARSRKHGSACFGGTHDSELTIPLTIRKVTVGGTTGKTDGTIAYADVTQAWRKPMMRAYKGVLGTQELLVCQR